MPILMPFTTRLKRYNGVHRWFPTPRTAHREYRLQMLWLYGVSDMSRQRKANT